MGIFTRHGDIWTYGVWTIQITETSTSAWATLSGPTRGAREAAAIDAQNLADAIEAWRIEPTADRLSNRELAAIMANRWRPGMEPKEIIDMCANIAIRLIGDVERQCEQDRNDDTATAHEEDSAELAAVTRILDEIGALREQDGRTLTPANRLRLYLDQRATAAIDAAEDNAAEWARAVDVERGLVLALAVMGHAAWKRGAQ